MAYSGYRTAFGQFNTPEIGQAFSKAVLAANPQFQGRASNPFYGQFGIPGALSAGQYFTGEGGTQYKTVSGVDPNQPGWGQRVEPGWELVGYMGGAPATGRARGLSPIAQPGYAVLQKQGTEAKAPADAAPSPAAQLQIAELTEQSQRYRTESEQQLAAANTKIAELSNEELQRQKATELQNRLAIQAASSQARGQAQANLRIAPGSQTSQTAGTSAFKRRRDQYRLSPIQSTAGINVPSGSVLNI